MDRACSKCGRDDNAYKILIGKPEGKRSLGRPRHRREDNIRLHVGKIGWEVAD
jgi:hypothetical protein